MDRSDNKLAIAYLLAIAEIATSFLTAFLIHSLRGYALISGGIVLLILRIFIPKGLPETDWLWSSEIHRRRVLQVGIGTIVFGVLMFIFWT